MELRPQYWQVRVRIRHRSERDCESGRRVSRHAALSISLYIIIHICYERISNKTLNRNAMKPESDDEEFGRLLQVI